MQKIMFNERYGLTTAVSQGSKTMTRRLVGNRMTEDDIKAYLKGYKDVAYNLAPYKIGEVVAVAQPYRDAFKGDWIKMQLHNDEAGFTNKMFVRADLMPLQIRITDIKVERLQDIGDEDCLKEGILKREIRPFNTIEIRYQVPKTIIYKDTPREAFAALIDKVSGKGTWKYNPWCFAYSFELVK